MYLELQNRIRKTFEAFIAGNYGVPARVLVEQPRRPEFGELALPFCFELAKSLKRPPRQIAEEVVKTIGPMEGVSKLEPAGGGYINVFLDRAAFAEGLRGGADEVAPGSIPGKIIVEHTNINPNKAAHIGHLRNAALGDTFVRVLRARGRQVEVQNYIDNTGVQVADVVVGFRYLEQKGAEEVRQLAVDASVRFDYHCWDLYARVSRMYEEDPDRVEWRGRTLQEIEHGEGESARLAEIIADSIVRLHLRTMYRLNVEYDLLPRESEILHLKFWEQAFELLKERGAIHLETEGKNKGCWVMRTDSSGAAAEPAETERGAEDAKVIVRSNGTVTYVGKDIAYQLWKFGLLGRDLYYRPFSSYPDGRQLWVSTSTPEQEQAPAFGHGDTVYNVIDARQSYLQNIVMQGLRALGFQEQADKSVHFAYEMVALSPRCCAELAIELSPEEQKRPYVEVSGRKGLGVKADDLIDQLLERALAEVRSRHAELLAETQKRVARQIAIGALRYFLLKYTRSAVIAFDFADALSFEGETGPYVQYATVRAANILRKFGAQPDFSRLSGETVRAAYGSEAGGEYWQLTLLASQASAMTEQALATCEPAVVAKYAFQLAQSFNNFYHRHHILRESDVQKQLFLLWLADLVRRQLTRALDLLGIEVPEVM